MKNVQKAPMIKFKTNTHTYRELIEKGQVYKQQAFEKEILVPKFTYKSELNFHNLKRNQGDQIKTIIK